MSRKLRVFLDSNVLDIGIENLRSNSGVILNLVFAFKVTPVAAELTVREVGEYFRRNHGRNAGWLAEELIRNLPDAVIIDERKSDAEAGEIQKKYRLSREDGALLAAARAGGADYFVSLNRHFLRNKLRKPAVITPKEFLEAMRVRPITNFE